MKKMVLINVITIVVLVILGVVGFHFYNQATSYVSTDNAKVDGEQIKVSAPASGEIKSFDVKTTKKWIKVTKSLKSQLKAMMDKLKQCLLKCLKTVQS